MNALAERLTPIRFQSPEYQALAAKIKAKLAVGRALGKERKNGSDEAVEDAIEEEEDAMAEAAVLELTAEAEAEAAEMLAEGKLDVDEKSSDLGQQIEDLDSKEASAGSDAAAESESSEETEDIRSDAAVTHCGVRNTSWGATDAQSGKRRTRFTFEAHEKLSMKAMELTRMPTRVGLLAGQLRSLDVSYNWIKSISHSQFSAFSKLECLSLRGNILQQVPSLAGLANLRVLDLSYNVLKSLPAHMATSLPSLQYLDVRHNRITADIASGSTESPAKRQKKTKSVTKYLLPPSLTWLDISNNMLTELPWQWFASADPLPETEREKEDEEQEQEEGSSLRYLHVAHNFLHSFPSWVPSLLPDLETLWLRSNCLGVDYIGSSPADVAMREKLVATFWDGFVGLTELRELSLSANDLKDDLWQAACETGVWQALAKLRVLDVSYNGISYVPEDFLSPSLVRGRDSVRKRGVERKKSRGRSAGKSSATRLSKKTSLASPASSDGPKESKSEGKKKRGRSMSFKSRLSLSSSTPSTPKSGRDQASSSTPLSATDVKKSSRSKSRAKKPSSGNSDSSSEEKRRPPRTSLSQTIPTIPACQPAATSLRSESALELRETMALAVPGLEVLNLAGNRISSVPAPVLVRLAPTLRYLNVAHNLVDSLPDEVLGLSKLQEFFSHRYLRIPNAMAAMNRTADGRDVVETMPEVGGPCYDKSLRERMPRLRRISLSVLVVAKTSPAVKMTLQQKAWMPLVCEIIPGLFLTSEFGARREHFLQSLGITHILSVVTRFDSHYPSDYEYLVHRVEDVPKTNLRCLFAETNAFIDAGRRRGNVLVHCAAGVSRSATLCAAYLINAQKISTRRAIALMHTKRPIVGPNKGFIRQLFGYEQMQSKLGTKGYAVTESVRTKRLESEKARKSTKTHPRVRQVRGSPS